MIDGIYYGDLYLSIEEAYLLEQYRLMSPEQKKLLSERMDAIAERKYTREDAGDDTDRPEPIADGHKK